MTEQRTLKQNAAMWKYCEMVAQDLNDKGLDFRTVMAKAAEIPWNKDMVKWYMWDLILEAMTAKESTTEMDTSDPGKVYEIMAAHLAKNWGVDIPFPSLDPPMIGDHMPENLR